ncbi:hypothetical protein DH2020_007228 [Rehmannia glutinosa]|uniref:RING-type domain-containing protein n=1 Tax=Rehmannia glutinosa TaxID=99300 RepID=A0ABR0TXZ9_REHGL
MAIQQPMAAVDLDSLLQAHCKIDSDEEHSPSPDHHSRTVDEILLNHSSDDDDDILTSNASSKTQRLSYSHSRTLVESDKYNSAAGPISNGNRTKYEGKVLPQLFGGGVIRSNAKPGAALAAATAASQSIPTPHATAIKLRRASVGVLQRSVSETTEKIVGSDDSTSSPSTVASRVYLEGLGFSAVPDGKSQEEEEDVKLDQFPSVCINSDSEKSDAGRRYSADGKIQENSDKVAEVSTNCKTLMEAADKDEDCTMPTFDSQNAMMDAVEKERDLVLEEVNVNEHVLSPLLNEMNGEHPEVCPSDESGEKNEIVGPTPILNYVNCNEDTTGEETANDFGNVVAEHGNGDDDASLQSDVAEILENLDSLGENKSDHACLQQKSHSSLKTLDLAEEIEKKLAFTGLHYEEGAAAQPMRLEGVSRGSTVLGYFDVNPNNAITRIISSQAFRHDHGSPHVVAVHINYIAVGMSKGSIVVVPSKYTAHQVDNMDAKHIGYGDGHYTVWDVQKASALKVITEHRAPVVHMLYLGQDTQVTRQFNVVSGDSKGVKLLDETTSRVVCASPLLYGEGHGGTTMSSQISSAVSTSSISSMMGGMLDEGVVIFITHQSALVAKVSPTVEVYGQIPKPDGIREGAMPYAAWSCMSQSLGSPSENAPVETSDKVSLLAIAWDRNIQVAKLLKSELKVLEKWTVESAAIGLAWLGDQTSFSVDGFQGNDLIAYHMYFTNTFGHPEKAYHNSVAIRGATIYILGPEHLIISRLLSWKERIEVLRKAGDWMGALNMAMALYDGQLHGVIDLPKNLYDIQRSVMPYLVELLQLYVIKYFHIYTFLELLEPYILKDMLGSLPPAIMQALVGHYSERGWLQRIEQCVLHMDILSLDFNQVVRLCREHSLHCALIYLFNKGLDDFTTPLEELLVVLRDSTRENATSLGYRMLVYLKYCFLGLAFPPGHGDLSPTRLPSLKKELLHFLLENSSAPNAWAVTRLPSNVAHANVLHLLELDTEATLEVLRCGFTEVEHSKPTLSSQESTNLNMDSAESQNLVQKVVEILSDILDASYFQVGSPICSDDVDMVEVWPSMKDVDHMYEFIAYCVTFEEANVSRDILSQIFKYLTSEINKLDTSEKTIEILKRREKQLLSLLQVVPETRWDASYVLHLSEKAEFHQVCGYIHAIRHHYVAAMDSYMKTMHEPLYAFSFIHDMLSLLRNEELDAFESAVISRIPDLFKLSREGTYFLIVDHFSGKTQYILSELQSHPESLFLYLKTVIEVQTTGILNISRLENLDVLDSPGARSAQQQSNGVQAYLEAISCSLKLLSSNRVNVTDEMMELYFELLCRYDRGSVLKFLESSESYRVEHCLRLCQEYGIIDAASFLLERVGEVGSALLLILSNLSEKFVMLDAEIRNFSSNTVLDNLNAILKKKVVADILDIVHACIGLCQRNSPRLKPEESESLWFQLLDFYDICHPTDLVLESNFKWMNAECLAYKAKYVFSKIVWFPRGNARTDSKREAVKDTLDGSLGVPEDEEGCKIKWKLPRIMLKLLSDNGNQEFGDFKLTILGMLGTYDFERRILDTAKSLIDDDTYYSMSLLRKGASHGYAPRSLVCCICNSLLAKRNSSDSGIQVFSCGHAMHLHCQLEEKRAFTIVECPICIKPRKKAQKSDGKSTLAENGRLVSRSPQQARGTPALHPHDHEVSDNAYSLQFASSTFKVHNLENMPQLRLAPPALYHEKVKKGIDILSGESSSSRTEKPSSSRQQLRM